VLTAEQRGGSCAGFQKRPAAQTAPPWLAWLIVISGIAVSPTLDFERRDGASDVIPFKCRAKSVEMAEITFNSAI